MSSSDRLALYCRLGAAPGELGSPLDKLSALDRLGPDWPPDWPAPARWRGRGGHSYKSRRRGANVSNLRPQRARSPRLLPRQQIGRLPAGCCDCMARAAATAAAADPIRLFRWCWPHADERAARPKGLGSCQLDTTGTSGRHILAPAAKFVRSTGASSLEWYLHFAPICFVAASAGW